MQQLQIPTQILIIYILLHLRFIGMMFSSPIFTATMAPAPFRYIFAVLLTACSVGIIKNEYIPTIFLNGAITLGILSVREIFIGIALGFISALPLYALQVAGELTGTAMGFSMAQVMDPTTQSQTSILGQLNFLVAIWLYFRWNGHLIMVRAVIESLKLVPLGQISFLPVTDLSLGKWLQELFILSVRMVLPFYCALVLSDVGLGFLARTVPQMNIFVVGLPVKVMLGFMVLAIVLPLTMDLIFTRFERWVEVALSAVISWRFMN